MLAKNHKSKETMGETYRRILTSQSGALNLYVNYILKEDLRSTTKEARLIRILQSISTGKNTSSMIAKQVKLKLSSVTYYLQELIKYDLIEKRDAKY